MSRVTSLAAGFRITTRSTGFLKSCLCSLNISRVYRFSRFLCTALPTFRETITPNLRPREELFPGITGWLLKTILIKLLLYRFPAAKTVLKSCFFLIFSCRSSPKLKLSIILNSYSFAPFSLASLEYPTSATGFHSFSKSVGFFSFALIGSKCRQHCSSSKCCLLY